MLRNIKQGVLGYMSIILKSSLAVFSFLFSLAMLNSAQALTLSQTPLFVGQNAKPTVMLAMSRDQDLFYKAYPDYSNLDGGALSSADITYRNDFAYAGYFDPAWCYSYSSNSQTPGASYFTPEAIANNHKCTGQWSGNFLNWSTMTRIDIMRKVLYGGKRSVDTAKSNNTPAKTILERAYVPKDSHAFVKTYSNSGDNHVSDFTPYSDSSLSFCNVSSDSSTTSSPLIRIARGNWSQWSHTEVSQCQWSGTGGTTTWITSPKLTTDKVAELVAKVSVCVPDKDADNTVYNETSNTKGRCKSYEDDSFKPIGLLQKFYRDVNFGLVTGTWGHPDMGGVLRKKAAQLAGNTTATDNEFSEDTGVFNTTVTSGVIKTIDAFRVSSASYGYTASQGDVSYSGNSDWRNPIGEIYAETLRYILGRAAPTSGFDSDDTWAIPGITRETTWNDPVPANLWCSKCSIILISSGPNSFDNDNIDPTKIGETTASLTRTTLNTLTDTIGLKEFGAISNSVFYGGSNVSTQCSIASKKLSELLGKCPELPTSLGTYDVAGLAYWAHTTDQRTAAGYSGNQTISTYSVELSEGLPSLDIPIGNKKVSLVPVCTNANTSRCSLVGVAVENLVTGSNGAPVSGSYLFYWEDQPWASDYDLDAVQRIQFCVGSACGSSAGVNDDEIKITNTLPYWATGTGSMFMHYIISGTDTTTAPYTTTYIGPQSDQAVHRGGYSQHNLGVISSLNSWSWYNTILPQGTDALPANTTADKYTMSKVFKAGTDTVTKVNTPLFYAAKYGSFKDTDTSHYPDTAAKWDVKNLKGEAVADGIPDNYFMMKNPSLLEDRLWDIFHDAVHDVASGSGVSTNSTKLETDTRIYQARFYTDSWYGELKSLKLSSAATSDYQTDWTTLNVTLTPASRNITSYSSGAGIEFVNSGFNAKYTSAQKTALGGNTEGPKVIDWVRGNDVTGYRKRLTQDNGRQLMGDIVNSTPVYAGAASQGYESLEATYGSETYADYVKNVKATRKSVIYVGANDGMLHAIDSQNGEELFAYVPSMIYSALPKISAAGYGSTISHVYAVDGPITVGDAFINGSWKTILVGTLGAGAQGFFVLDVTDPEHFSKSKVLFEIGAGDYNAVGNIMGKPLIAPVAGRWKIVVGNGYNSSEGYAQLLVIDIAAPSNSTHSKVIKAGTVNNNGLGSAVALQNTSTKAVDYIYAGDLLGNMWKFDLSSSNSSNWGVTLNNKPLFTAKDPLGNAQPIFASPTLGRNSHLPSATMVYFGTGKYMEAADIGSTEMAKVQTFYGVADEGVALTYTGSRAGILHEKTMVTSAFTRDVNDLGGSAVAIDWEHKKGWFLDFPAGERMVTKPLMLYNRLIFPTIVPNTDVCSFGGAGWLMELVAVDDIFGVTDQLLPMNGTHLDYFLPGDLTKLKSDAGTVLNECNIKGDCSSTILNDPKVTSDSAGRVSWRQVH